MTHPHLIIFDCDGTLVDSQNLIVAAMERAFGALGLAPPPREAVLGIVGLSLPQAISRLAPGAGEDVVMQIRKEYSDAFGELRQNPDNWEPMYEGAHEAVLELAGRDGILLGIATGKSRKGVDRMLKHFQLEGRFATIQTADNSPSKPHSGMIDQAIGETGADPSSTVMIGDTTFDMEMARNAGVKGLGVSWGYHPVDALRSEGAKEVAEDYPHLLRILYGLLSGQRAAE